MTIRRDLRTNLPTDPNGLRGGGTVVLNPFEIVDTANLPDALPVSLGLDGLPLDPRGSIYVRRRTLERDSPIPPSEIPDTLSGANSTIPIILGEVRTVALPFYARIVNRYFHILYIVGEGEIDSYQTISIDGTETNISARPIESSFALSALDSSASCTLYVGNGTQNVSTIVGAQISGYTDQLADFAVIYLRLPSVVVQRMPRVEVLVRGKAIKDYTDGETVRFTSNAGNILIHWLEKVEGRTVDTASAQALAEACAEDVGGSPRREAGFALNRPVAATATREILRAHAATWVIDTGNAVKFVPDRPAESVMDIGEDMILSDVQITTSSLRNQPDDVIVNWQENSTGITQQARATGTIGNQPSNVQFVGIHNAAQAKREAIERLNHLTLERETVTFEVTMKGVRLEPGDVFRLTHSPTGLADKPFRCTGIEIRHGTARITAREYQPNTYSDTVQTDPLIPDTDLPSPIEVPTLTGLTLSAQNRVSESGIDPSIEVNWNDPEWPFIALILIEVFNNDVSPQTLDQTVTVAADQTSAIVAGLTGDTSYEIKARIQSTAGTFGEFANGFETTLAPDLAAWWPCEATDDPLIDIVGGYDLTVAGSPTTLTGQQGTAVRQASTSDAYSSTVNGLANLEPPWTYLGWFYVHTMPTGPSKSWLMGRWPNNSTDDVFGVRVDLNGDIEIIIRQIDGSIATWTTGKTMTVSTWHFVAVSYLEGHLRLKFDGDDMVFFETTIRPSLQNSKFTLANDSVAGNGLIGFDEVKVYRSAKSSEELEAIRSADL